MPPIKIQFSFPPWLDETFCKNNSGPFASLEEAMELAIDLSRKNVEQNTGGPFGALIVNTKSMTAVGFGVNLVVPENAAPFHAEIVAILHAQRAVKNFDLGATGLAPHALVISADPCAMCVGATVWSGVTQVVCGARTEDIESITGFDEGPIHSNWVEKIEQRGIKVARNVLGDRACAILQAYAASGQVIYNGRRGTP